MVIYKYELSVETDLMIPEGGKILTVGAQGDGLFYGHWLIKMLPL